MLSGNAAERTSNLDMTGSKPVFIRFSDNVFAVSVIRLSKYPRKRENAQRPDTACFYAKEIGVKSKQSNKTVYDYDSDSLWRVRVIKIFRESLYFQVFPGIHPPI
jgi:hypothetical protein